MSAAGSNAPRHSGRWTLLYDGRCPLCAASAARLVRLGMPGAIEALDLHTPGVLERFPAISHEQAMRAIHLIGPDGRIDVGAGALARVAATRGGPWKLARAYCIPLIRQVCDGIYWLIARNRYRLLPSRRTCPDGTCQVHAGSSVNPPGAA